MFHALHYMREIRIARPFGIRNYLNNYLPCLHILRARVNAWNWHPRLVGVRNYSSDIFALSTRLTHSRIRVELASPPTWGDKLFK